MAFFEDLYFVGFCDEINFENPKKCPRKHQQGGKLEDSYCSARDWDGKDYLRLIPRVVW
jgi:hypothetical protein